MTVGAEAAGVSMPGDAPDSGDDGDRQVLLDQDRRLLDVDLEIGGDALGVEAGLAVAQGLGVAAELGKVLGQGPSGVDTAQLESGRRQAAEGRRAVSRGLCPAGSCRD
jgi:hypothetical protein